MRVSCTLLFTPRGESIDGAGNELRITRPRDLFEVIPVVDSASAAVMRRTIADNRASAAVIGRAAITERRENRMAPSAADRSEMGIARSRNYLEHPARAVSKEDRFSHLARDSRSRGCRVRRRNAAS
jgi:hypothetical protein